MAAAAVSSSRKHLSIQQAAWALHAVPAKVERLALAGAFPGAVRLKGVWRIPARDVARHKARKPGGPLPNAVVKCAASRFWCTSLRGELCAGHCVKRQQASDDAGTKDVERGQDTRQGACRTEQCEQGRAIREAIGDQPTVKRRRNRRSWVLGTPARPAVELQLSSVEPFDDVPMLESVRPMAALG